MNVVDTVLPLGNPIALVVDSPHSGTFYPEDFGFVCDGEMLRMAEDTHVQDLFAMAPMLGGTLVHARFPRSYIDVNRAETDIDPALLDGRWPGPLMPTEKSRFGMGLIRRLCAPGMPMYDRRLSVAEVQHRIDHYYRPYHAALEAALDSVVRRFGHVWHIDCHSMKSRGNELGPDPGSERPDMCVSDYRGATADTSFTRFVASKLDELGYRTRINDPYLGAEIVRRYGTPGSGRHSIQIEIKRSLYMDEVTRKPNDGYIRLKNDLTLLLMAVKEWIA